MNQKKLIWLAIVFSTVIYAVVLYVVSRNWPAGRSFDEAVRHPLALMAYSACLILFGVGFLVKRSMRRPLSAFVASLAIFEACAICGLFAAFITQDYRVYIPAWIVALIGMFYLWTKIDEQPI